MLVAFTWQIVFTIERNKPSERCTVGVSEGELSTPNCEKKEQLSISVREIFFQSKSFFSSFFVFFLSSFLFFFLFLFLLFLSLFYSTQGAAARHQITQDLDSSMSRRILFIRVFDITYRILQPILAKCWRWGYVCVCVYRLKDPGLAFIKYAWHDADPGKQQTL